MKFSVLVAIVDNELEEKAIEIAKQNGAGGVTILNGRGRGLKEKKIFFGLTYEGTQSILLFILEKKISVDVMKAMIKELELKKEGNGIVFSLPVEHIAGIDVSQLSKFKDYVINDI
ncbi:P-II family nitrogen regulator [Nitrosophilus alvini]|uniref:P-II family nitrogen regulator n=1 Tax=Nitrosophilus alvini TaxID=2714855 RepID=UPI00190C4F77|nr:hypothetical protein [Nitrosophilus alvini]